MGEKSKTIFDVQIRIGEHDLTTTGEGSLTEMTIDVTSYTNHESYVFPDNDIVIIELTEAVDVNTYTPACMAKTSDTTTFDGKNAWVYGELTEGTILILIILFCPRLGGTVLRHRTIPRRLDGGGGGRGHQRGLLLCLHRHQR